MWKETMFQSDLDFMHENLKHLEPVGQVDSSVPSLCVISIDTLALLGLICFAWEISQTSSGHIETLRI